MAIAHGRLAEFKVDDTGGTLRDLSDYLTDVDMPRERDLADTSTLGDDDREHVTGLKGFSFSANGFHDPTIDGYLHGVYEAGLPVDFEYYPQGNTTGKVKLTGQVILSNYTNSTGVGGAGTTSVSFTGNGAVTRALVS